MKIIIDVTVLSFSILIGVVYFSWDVPFNLRTRALDVITGFPVYNDSINGPLSTEITTITKPDTISTKNGNRRYGWRCSLINGKEDECQTVLTDCRDNNQFSFLFWQTTNSTCEKDNEVVACDFPAEVGDICTNVVTDIIEINGITHHFKLKDVEKGAILVQRYILNDVSKCYQQGDVLRVQSSDKPVLFGTNDLPECRIFPIRFEINEEKQCQLPIVRQDYEAIREKIMTYYNEVQSASFCNYGTCNINIVSQENPVIVNNSSVCLLPSLLQLTILHKEGLLLGVLSRVNWKICSISDVRINFKVEFKDMNKVSFASDRFAHRRGRFYCPSEITCFKELWFPLSNWKSLSITRQLGFAIFATLTILLTVMNKKNHTI